MFIRTIAILLLIGFGSPEATPASEDTQPGNVYEAVLAGKKCQEGTSQNLSCRYKVGQSLDFEIGPFGDPYNTITFYRSDYNGGYYAKFGMLHGCVVITPGVNEKRWLSDFAFVSPKNGKVYRDWVKCQTGL